MSLTYLTSWPSDQVAISHQFPPTADSLTALSPESLSSSLTDIPGQCLTQKSSPDASAQGSHVHGRLYTLPEGAILIPWATLFGNAEPQQPCLAPIPSWEHPLCHGLRAKVPFPMFPRAETTSPQQIVQVLSYIFQIFRQLMWGHRKSSGQSEQNQSFVTFLGGCCL